MYNPSKAPISCTHSQTGSSYEIFPWFLLILISKLWQYTSTTAYAKEQSVVQELFEYALIVNKT